jgi:tRNA (guanine-N7-)-methyltransferase
MARQNDPRLKRTYGRRKGHRLSARKQRLIDTVLPALRLDLEAEPPRPLRALFTPSARHVALEIGFGAGEHLAHQAARHPEHGFIGCEVFINGVAALLSHIEEKGLGNIRIHDGDARELLDWLPDASLDQVFILFPDPWPKTRHHKRRLISPQVLEALARVMKPGAELRIASDIPDYVRATLLEVHRSRCFDWCAEDAFGWRDPPADWPGTRYEAKALREGRRCCYLAFTRR